MAARAKCSAAPIPLADLRQGRPALVLCVLLGIEPAHEITLRSGENTLVASFYLADSTEPLGLELRIWGSNALRFAHLRPLYTLHVPAVTLRLSTGGIRSLSCGAPHQIESLDERTCACKQSAAADALADWSRRRHGALLHANLHAASPPRQRRRPSTAGASVAATVATPSAVEWIRARVTGVRIRARDGGKRDVAAAIVGGVQATCGACGLQGWDCKCGALARTVTLDEEAVAVRVQLKVEGSTTDQLVVAHCTGEDLLRLLLIDDVAALTSDTEAVRRAADALKALASDTSVFEVALQRVSGEPFPRLRELRF